MNMNKNLVLIIILIGLTCFISVERFISTDKSDIYNYNIPKRTVKLKPIPNSLKYDRPMGRLFDNAKQILISHEPKNQCSCNTSIFNGNASTACECYLHR